MTNLVNLLTLENLTLLIAVWGAVLSTYKVLSDHSKNTRKLKVEVAYGFLSQGNTVSAATISITAINTGFRDITLNSMGFVFPDDRKSIMLEPQGNVAFPHTLTEGNNCLVWKFQRQFASELKKNGYSGKVNVRGYFQDATGKMFTSKPMTFDIEQALSQTD